MRIWLQLNLQLPGYNIYDLSIILLSLLAGEQLSFYVPVHLSML